MQQKNSKFKKVAIVHHDLTFGEALRKFWDRECRDPNGNVVKGRHIYTKYKRFNPEILDNPVSITGNAIVNPLTNRSVIEFVPNNIKEVQERSDWSVSTELTPLIDKLADKIVNDFSRWLSMVNVLDLRKQENIFNLAFTFKPTIQEFLNEHGIVSGELMEIILATIGSSLEGVFEAEPIVQNLEELNHYYQYDDDDINNILSSSNNVWTAVSRHILETFESVLSLKLFQIALVYDEHINGYYNSAFGTDKNIEGEDKNS